MRNWPTTASPGIGRQHFAYWIATPSTPRSVSDAELRGRRRRGFRRPCPAARVSACATTNDSRLPSPMSARMSSWLLAPYSFAQRFPAIPRDRVRLDLQRGQRLVEQPLAERRRLLLLQPLQVVADARARLAGGDERQPRRIGARGRRGQDLDVVAVLELGAQRQQLVVDARRDAVVADVGVHARRRSRPRSRRAAAP